MTRESSAGGTMLFGKEHVRRYQETDGAEGHDWNGTTALILTTTGRSSGLARSTPLIYRRDGGSYVVVASYGGSDEHPQWYRNILADPEVGVQVGAERFTARARTASPEEKRRLWPVMTATWPQYDEYQAKTDRDIPVVVLDPVD
ncbi:deazaflavin-dependent oxidoreductase (nitroreductase family) [Nocardiopsis composta]|uniref:Deazaflavin-dependent oxidoreductase (Nitroreductase family) n=2 Tax=Nocardiopsis composta TaxID=157465 RepID=A0A7W8VGX7_9ACTN|nr:deazaflavin-dependent oxidoreductase (nitroreductase family) [Nocardiopsis composta]